VALVVTESLADGMVIHDMDSVGNVLSLLLSTYPPLFRAALGHFRNHGTLTMVVPAELAYGEAGYLPKSRPMPLRYMNSVWLISSCKHVDL